MSEHVVHQRTTTWSTKGPCFLSTWSTKGPYVPRFLFLLFLFLIKLLLSTTTLVPFSVVVLLLKKTL